MGVLGGVRVQDPGTKWALLPGAQDAGTARGRHGRRVGDVGAWRRGRALWGAGEAVTRCPPPRGEDPGDAVTPTGSAVGGAGTLWPAAEAGPSLGAADAPGGSEQPFPPAAAARRRSGAGRGPAPPRGSDLGEGLLVAPELLRRRGPLLGGRRALVRGQRVERGQQPVAAQRRQRRLEAARGPRHGGPGRPAGAALAGALVRGFPGVRRRGRLRPKRRPPPGLALDKPRRTPLPGNGRRGGRRGARGSRVVLRGLPARRGATSACPSPPLRLPARSVC